MSRWSQILAKMSSLGGQDMRLAVTGGTKFPTEDSKGTSSSLLRQSQHAAEVGPSPAFETISPKGPTIKDVAVKQPSPKGGLPKIGEAMNKLAQAIANDPLIRYMNKQAEQVLIGEHLPETSIQQINQKIDELFVNAKDRRLKGLEKERFIKDPDNA